MSSGAAVRFKKRGRLLPFIFGTTRAINGGLAIYGACHYFIHYIDINTYVYHFVYWWLVLLYGIWRHQSGIIYSTIAKSIIFLGMFAAGALVEPYYRIPLVLPMPLSYR